MGEAEPLYIQRRVDVRSTDVRSTETERCNSPLPANSVLPADEVILDDHGVDSGACNYPIRAFHNHRMRFRVSERMFG